MFAVLSRYWWVFVLRGIAAIAFGIAALVWPGLTLLGIIYLFGAYVLVDGVFSLITGIEHLVRGESRAWTTALEGLAGIVVGLIAFSFPGLTGLALVFLIAAWALVTGVLELAAAFRLREEMAGEWALALAGAISVLFGLALVAFPRSGALAVIWTIGVFSIIFGASMVSIGIRLRSAGHARVRVPGRSRDRSVVS
jgi:uncharacterized membrane protein HdeD (DUF308 family)